MTEMMNHSAGKQISRVRRPGWLPRRAGCGEANQGAEDVARRNIKWRGA